MFALATLIMIADSIDRASLGIAGKSIQDEFAYSTQTMGWIFSAFSLGYALSQVPWGYAGDRFGPRGVLTVAVIWSSVFTVAMSLVPRLPWGAFGLVWSFYIVRVLVGVGVAAAPTNVNKVVALWMGPGERGIGSSSAQMGSGLGSAVAPIFIAWSMQRWGWRTSFYLCGALGLAVVFVWHLYATNRPEDHPRVNAAELEIIRPAGLDNVAAGRPRASGRRPPWGRILTSVSAWGLFLSYACQAYPIYVYYNWFYIYLVRVRGLTLTQGGFWGSTPFIAMTLLAPLGGWVSDRAVRKLGKRNGRRIAVWLGMGCSAALIWAGSHTTNTTAAILLLAAAAGFNFFAVSSFWATSIDLTRNYSGTLSSVMNMCANLGGWLSPILTARIAVSLGWTQALDFAGVMTLASGLLWIFINADDDLEESHRAV
jgi:ACS family glucarate transporter-like MFS transporter